MHNFINRPLSPLGQVLWGGAMATLLGVGSLLGCPVWAQTAISEAQLTTIVGADALIEGQIAAVNDVAQDGEEIRTTQARTQLLLNTGFITRMGPGSTYTVGPDCIAVAAGKILISGPSQVCYGNVVVAVQGTTYLMQVLSSGVARLSVLEGSLQVSNPQNTGIPVVGIDAGEVVEIDRDGNEGSRSDLSAAQYEVLLQDELMVLFGALPDMAPLRTTYTRLFPGDRVPNPLQRPVDRKPSGGNDDSSSHSSPSDDDGSYSPPDDDSYSPPSEF